MFFEGPPRLLDAGVTIPYVQVGDPRRIVVEAYPGVLARQLIGRRTRAQPEKAVRRSTRRTPRNAWKDSERQP
jgi:hypothetical protein